VSKSNADYVLLSMGGNDFKNIYWRNKQYITPWTAVAGIEKNVRTVLNALFDKHPTIKVVTYGYDFPGAVDGLLDGSLWGGPKDASSSIKFLVWMYNVVGIRAINYSAMQLGGSFQKLSKEFEKKGFSFTYVPLWGSLQSVSTAQQACYTHTCEPFANWCKQCNSHFWLGPDSQFVWGLIISCCLRKGSHIGRPILIIFLSFFPNCRQQMGKIHLQFH
jgi:hypothetical protein